MSGNDLFAADPNKSVEELLVAIQRGAIGGHNKGTLTLALPPFSALLVRLSRDADARATKIEKLTNKLLLYTVALFGLTFLLVVKECFDVYKQYAAPNEATYQGRQNDQIKPQVKGSAHQTLPVGTSSGS